MGRVKEQPRRCVKCGFGWWAVEAKKPKGVKSVWGPMAAGLDAAALVGRKAANQAIELRDWERWGVCSRCGSQDIRTVKEKGFVPTGLAEAGGSTRQSGAAAGPPALVVTSQDGPSPLGPKPPGVPQEGNRDGQWEIGARVTIRQFGYRGLRGTVSRRGPMGNYTVDLDRGGKATSIPGDKLDPA